MRKWAFILTVCLMAQGAVAARGAEVAFHGDLNNRFMLYTNHNDWLNLEQEGSLKDKAVEESWGEIKYRLWLEAGTNDRAIKGVYAIELGALRFGRPGQGKSRGASYSGDSVNIETRWAYTEFQLPWVERSARFRIGLQPFSVNPWLWRETAAGVNFDGSWGDIDYQLAWMRTFEVNVNNDDISDADNLDNFFGRLNVKPADGLDAGLFFLYSHSDGDLGDDAIDSRGYLLKQFADQVDLDLAHIGLDGSYNRALKRGKFFCNWDLIYEIGSIDDAVFDDSDFSGNVTSDDFDVSAWFLHADIGYRLDKTKLTYTFWYASGDDDPTDSDFDGYLAIDLDRADSVVVFEGGYTDDNYFSERPYFLDKGFVMNKLALDYQATARLQLGVAGMYMMTAEDIEYRDNNGRTRKEDQIGFEVDGYLSYMLFNNMEFAVNAGYLFAGDALDAFEGRTGSDGFTPNRDGNADEDIFVSTARIRYKF